MLTVYFLLKEDLFSQKHLVKQVCVCEIPSEVHRFG